MGKPLPTRQDPTTELRPAGFRESGFLGGAQYSLSYTLPFRGTISLNHLDCE